MLPYIFQLLPLVAAPICLAAPVQPIAAGLEPRQRGGGDQPGNGGRPTGNWRNGQGGSATSAAPVSSTVAQTTAGNVQATAATGVNSVVAGSNTAAGTAPAATGGGTIESTGEAVDDPQGTGTGSGTASETTGAADNDAASSSDNTGSTGSTDGSEGSGPVGTGWDKAYNPADLSTYTAAGLQWFYDWLLQPSIDTAGAEYVPMVKRGGDVAGLADAMANWPSGTQYVLSFNEPDTKPLVGGTDLTHADAAKSHNEIVKILDGKYKISTPGVTRGGEVWMDQWIAECEKLGGCHYDFTAYHYYGTDVQDLIKNVKAGLPDNDRPLTIGNAHLEVQMMYDRYGKEVWVTEWACHEFNPEIRCSPEETEAFMSTAIEWFRGEGASMVGRWAWFGAFDDMTNWHNNGFNMDAARIANADGTVNALGEKYLSL